MKDMISNLKNQYVFQVKIGYIKIFPNHPLVQSKGFEAQSLHNLSKNLIDVCIFGQNLIVFTQGVYP